MFDLIIKGALVIDGSGTKGKKQDIGIIKEEIKALENLKDAKSKQFINAKGLAAAPGFIDIHTHSEEAYLINPRAESKIHQGVTTEVVGNCGSSPFPLEEKAFKDYQEKMKLEYGINVNWHSLDEYFERLNNQGLGLNVITLTGQGTLRTCVLGYEDRAPKDDELNKMKNMLRNSLEEGSWGLSSGLIYIPSCFAGKEELIELTKVVKEYDGIYAAHIRNEGENLISAVEEVIEIARHSKVKLEIAHHKASGKKNWGKVKESLNLIKKAQSAGLEVFCDQYPYLASNTSLDVLLPNWIIQKNRGYLKKNLQNKAFYLKIKKEIKKRLNVSWKDIWISCIYTKNKDCIGKNIAEIAKIKNKESEEIILNLFIEEECPVEAIFFSMSEKDLIKVMKSPYTSIGSDAMARAPYGILSKGRPHPRAYGTFPRILGYYVRDKKILTLEEAIYKMTFFSANKLGLKKRGLIKVGNFADLVMFNPKTVKDSATFIEPQVYPQGIEYVLVNGKIVIENGKHTGILAGKILKRNN